MSPKKKTVPGKVQETPETPETLAADAPPGDTYGREQAARVLGVSSRRVSQLAEAGRLEVLQQSPLRLSAESVHNLRAERRSAPAAARSNTPPDSVAEQVARIVEMVTAEQRKAITAGESLLQEVSQQRDEYRQEVERLRSEAAVLREQLETKSRKWWQR